MCGDECFKERDGRVECVNEVCQVKNVTDLSREVQNLLSIGLLTEESILEEDCSTGTAIVNACGDTYCDLDTEECVSSSGVCRDKYHSKVVCNNDNNECYEISDLCRESFEKICHDQTRYMLYLTSATTEVKYRRDLCSTTCSNDDETSSARRTTCTHTTTVFASVVAVTVALIFI
jgi:hypothetical protein